MLKKIYVIFILVIVSAFMHPLHVSVTNINFDEKSNKFIISIKVFKNDFENIISRKFNVQTDFTTITKEDSININNYISENLKISFDDIPLKNINCTSIKANEESVWVYFEITNYTLKKSISFNNTIFMDLYGDQSNLIIIKYKEKDLGFQLRKGDNDILFLIN